MKEFLQRESGKMFDLPVDPEERLALETAAEACDKRAKAQGPCTAVANFLNHIGYNPGWSATKTCVIFDEAALQTGIPSEEALALVATHCGSARSPAFWNQTVAQQDILHFPAGSKDYRLLAHFYGMIYFSDPVQSHYYKRFVRDYLHYHDAIYCAAGKVVQAVQLEGKSRGLVVDDEGAGGYSAMVGSTNSFSTCVAIDFTTAIRFVVVPLTFFVFLEKFSIFGEVTCNTNVSRSQRLSGIRIPKRYGRTKRFCTLRQTNVTKHFLMIWPSTMNFVF
jgi:hypothetical protein